MSAYRIRHACRALQTRPLFFHPPSVKCHSTETQTEDVLKTCLYDFHVLKGGKMVPFAGYWMPVQYGTESMTASHLHVRGHVGIFDVSHMLQTKVYGKDRVKYIETAVVGDIEGLESDRGTLTAMTTSDGGIIDDLIVTKTSQDHLYVVSNAGCRDKDLKNLKEKLEEFRSDGFEATLEVSEDLGLVAVQGPGTARVLQPLVDFDIEKLVFMRTAVAKVAGVPNCRVTRCGYTGEDGVEISVHSKHAAQVVNALLESRMDEVKMAGLGARDSLRLEAGLCLYGNDLDEDKTPVEASLAWLIPKRRRELGNFPGAAKILQQLKDKPNRRRVGFISRGPPARAHTPILNNEGQPIGEVTSGCPSPSLQLNVAMGYISENYSKVGTRVLFEVRKKLVDAEVTKMPFVPHRYYIPK